MSGLASLVNHAPRFGLWLKVGDTEPLAQFHSKFWGKGMMEEEEQQWSDDRESENPGSDGYKVQDGRVDKDGDVPMDADDDLTETTDTDECDDIIAGCCTLDIGINNISRIWARAEYIRIYDYLEEHYSNAVIAKASPGAVLTGQPGIGEFAHHRHHRSVHVSCKKGKSFWIYYALRRYLAERKPVIWLLQGIAYFFIGEGVYVVPKNFPPGAFKCFVRTLVDSDESKDGIPSHLIYHGTSLFVIYSTSPAKERWSRMEKTVNDVTVFVMNPWTRREIHLAWVIDHTVHLHSHFLAA